MTEATVETEQQHQVRETIGDRGEGTVFVISQPRAGSTLLQRMLAAHPEVHTTAEPWVMLHPLFALKEAGVEAVYDQGLARRAGDEFAAALPGGYTAYVEGLRQMGVHIYRAALKPTGKGWFVDKTPRYYFIIPELQAVFPGAKFIILLRNPLAVLASILDVWLSWGHWWENDALQQYRYDLLAAPRLLLDGARLLGDAVAVVRYEELVLTPETVLKDLSARVGLTYDSGMLDYGGKPKPVGSFGDTHSVDRHNRPVAGYTDRWLQVLAEPHCNLLARLYLEHLGSGLVTELGYDFNDLATRLQQTAAPTKVPVVELNAVRAAFKRMTDLFDLSSNGRLPEPGEPAVPAMEIPASTPVPHIQNDEPKGIRPVFITGLPRTGTTALLRALEQTAPFNRRHREGHYHYWLLEGVAHLLADPQRYPNALTGTTVCSGDNLKKLLTNLAQAVDRFNREVYEMPAGGRWIDKTPDVQQVAVLPVLARLYPDCRIIHMSRHPRDQVLSQVRKHGARQSPENLLRHWAAVQQLFRIQVKPQLDPRALLELRQEDMASDPDATGARVAEFLGLEPGDGGVISQAMRERRENRTPGRGEAFDYSSETPLGFTQLVTRICSDEMRHWGYS